MASTFAAALGRAADDDVVGLLVLIDLADLRAADERRDGVAHLAGRQAEPRGGIGPQADLHLRHEHPGPRSSGS